MLGVRSSKLSPQRNKQGAKGQFGKQTLKENVTQRRRQEGQSEDPGVLPLGYSEPPLGPK